MFTLEELRKQLVALTGQLRALNDKAVDEKNIVRSFTDEEQAEYDSLKQKVSNVRAAIARKEEENKLESEAEQLRALKPGTPSVQVIREEYHNSAGEVRAYEPANKGGLGTFMKDIRLEAEGRGEDASKALKILRAALGANEKVGSEGGFLPQSDHAEMLFDAAKTSGVIAPLCAVINSSSNSTTVTMLDETSKADGSQYGGVAAYWRAEAGSLTASKPKFRQAQVTLSSLDALFYATEEQLGDAPQLESFADQAFRTVMAWKLDDAIIGGNGAGKPFGILGAPGTISVAKESGQVAATLNYQNIDNMKNRMLVDSRNKAKFFMHADAYQAVKNIVKTGTNSDLFVGQQLSEFLEYPYQVIDQCRALGSVGDIILADFSQYFLFKKVGIAAAQSMHVAFVTNERAYRWTMRVAGQPMRASAITDSYGSNTRAPFIVTAVRA